MDDDGITPIRRVYGPGDLADSADANRIDRLAEEVRTRFDVMSEKLDRLLAAFESGLDDVNARVTAIENSAKRRLKK